MTAGCLRQQSDISNNPISIHKLILESLSSDRLSKNVTNFCAFFNLIHKKLTIFYEVTPSTFVQNVISY